jgi:radical SAM enzyme (rSAM/lipoprotein system)
MSVSKLSLRKRIGLELFRRYKKNAAKIHKLNYIFWECTLKCNLKCIHCGSDCRSDASIKDMPLADFLKSIEDISEIVDPHETMIVITGGEPLLRKDIELAGINLYKRGFPWGIVTNGMLLYHERLISLINSGLRAITVSFDGKELSHNWLRGNPHSYTNALKAIELIAKYDELESDVVTCVNQRNFNELDEIKNLLIEKGIKKWRVFTVFPVGRAKNYNDLQLDPLNFKQLFDFIALTREEAKIHLNYGCEGYLGNYESEVRDNLFMCHAGINIASILADGSISACPNLRENFVQGNIYSASFKDIWQNKYQLFRNRSWTKTGICANCSHYRYCEGNGMHLRDENSSLLFCHLNRIIGGEKQLE